MAHRGLATVWGGLDLDAIGAPCRGEFFRPVLAASPSPEQAVIHRHWVTEYEHRAAALAVITPSLPPGPLSTSSAFSRLRAACCSPRACWSESPRWCSPATWLERSWSPD